MIWTSNIVGSSTDRIPMSHTSTYTIYPLQAFSDSELLIRTFKQLTTFETNCNISFPTTWPYIYGLLYLSV